MEWECFKDVQLYLLLWPIGVVWKCSERLKDCQGVWILNQTTNFSKILTTSQREMTQCLNNNYYPARALRCKLFVQIQGLYLDPMLQTKNWGSIAKKIGPKYKFKAKKLYLSMGNHVHFPRKWKQQIFSLSPLQLKVFSWNQNLTEKTTCLISALHLADFKLHLTQSARPWQWSPSSDLPWWCSKRFSII